MTVPVPGSTTHLAGNTPMVISMTRTSCLDADHKPTTEKVRIHRHQPDMHTLADDVGNRIKATLEVNPTGCHYFNPAVTVFCAEPVPVFFRTVRREQSDWCRRTNGTFLRRARRRASSWVSGGEWISHKFRRYLDRALCFTGILFIDGELVLPHKWNDRLMNLETKQ